MRKMQGKMKVRIVLFVLGCVLLVSVSGCGRADRDDIAEDLSSANTDASAGDADMNHVLGDDKAEERLQYTMQGSNGRKITVDAEIEAPDISRMNIYEETAMYINDESLAEFAGAVFDEGEYQIIKPYEICSEEELEQAKMALEIEAAEYETDAVPTAIRKNLDDVNYYLSNLKETTYIETVDNQIIYILPDGTWKWKLQGKIDGNMWSLSGFVSEYEGGSNQILKLSPYDANQNWSSTVVMSDATAEYNACDLQTAKNLANEAVEKLGYGDMTVIDTKQLMPEGGSTENLDGYRFTYGRCPEGIETLYMDNSYAKAEGADVNSAQEYIFVYVNTGGVALINFSDTYKLGTVMSENMTVMPFETVDEIARAEMVNYLEEYNGADITVSQVRLGYMTITYNGSEYSLVPVWAYYYDTDIYDAGKKAMFAVNALDGGIINLENYYLN